MKRKISILFAICLLCALASGCSGEKSVSKVELPAVVPESPAQESVTPESTAQDLPEQNNSAPSQADVELDVPDAPEGKITLVLGGIGLRDDTLASLVNNFNAENTKYTVVIDDYAENTQSREQAETVMQTKLFAGDAADIYYFRNDMLSPLPWISAGLLYDLDPLIASDSEISEEDIIPWTAMHEYGGLYLLSPTFGVVALSCSQQTQKLHTGWTITEYLDIEKSLRPEQDIFYMYLYGYSAQQIADTLTNQARSTYFGKSCWSSSGIVSILRNERHCGDVLTRKTVTENYRTHRTLKNRGEKPQSRYYNHHDAIIRRDDFNAVQRMLDNAKYGNKSILPELRVIHDGLLKGFVSINPRWSGFKEGDYLSASRSAYTDIPTDGAPSQIPADATFAVNAGDFDLRGFEITRTEFLGTHSQPFVTFADKKVKFSAACVRHFGAKRYVELLINPLEMKFAVRPTDSSNRSGVIISSNYSGKPQPREISAAAFSDTIFHLFGWNTACKYRINGILCEDAGQLVYIFDVADSETFIRSQELSVRAASANEETIHPLSTLGKHVRAIPEQWVGTFGKEFYLHECSLSALEHMTRSNWSLNLQGQLFETGKKLHVTDFDELRQYIMKELGGTMPQEDRNGNME